MGKIAIFQPEAAIQQVGDYTPRPNQKVLWLATPFTVPAIKDSVIDIVTNVTGGGRRVATRVRVVERVSDLIYVLNGWPHGTCIGGAARKITYDYSIYTAVAPREDARTRKTGGPFTRFRGKR